MNNLADDTMIARIDGGNGLRNPSLIIDQYIVEMAGRHFPRNAFWYATPSMPETRHAPNVLLSRSGYVKFAMMTATRF